MTLTSSPSLLYRTQLWSDESVLNSYQIRLRELNRVWSLQELGTILGEPEARWTARNLLINAQVVKSLGQLAGILTDLSKEVPQPLASAAAATQDTYVLRWARGELSVQFWMQDFAQVCPTCLTEKGYLDHTLDFWHVPVCTEHQCLLLDACADCGMRLQFERPALSQCGGCGADLRMVKTATVEPRLCELAHELTALRLMNIEAAAVAVPLEPSQVAALIAHFASGEYVQSIANYLPGSARYFPASQRLVGLSWLADCTDGLQINAGRLREAIIRRTRYLGPFQKTRFFDWWLLDGLERTDLGVHAANAVTYGRSDDVSHLASHQVEWQGLRASSKAELRKLLKSTAYEVEELVRHTGLDKDADSLGYDAEELVAAVAFYRACLTESALDACFGLKGLTSQLLSHGKLQEFGARAAPPRRVTPDSLSGFLTHLERRVPWSETTADAVSVKKLVEREEEPARATTHLLLAMGAPNSRLVGWAPPFRLVDVLSRSTKAGPPRTRGLASKKSARHRSADEGHQS